MSMKKLLLIQQVLLVVLFTLGITYLNAQNPQKLYNAEVKPLNFIKTTLPVRDIETVHDGIVVKFPKTGYHPKGDWPLHDKVNPNALPIGADPAWQKNYAPPNRRRTISLDYEGLGPDGNFDPGDPALDVGPNHVVQMVNGLGGSNVEIRDKAGAVLTNFIFEGVTTIEGLGDPIVIYDQLADRWLLSEFAANGNVLVVAISTSPDPTGSYFIYTFNTPDFPDYPKYSIWNDSYIVTTNENNPRIYALDRIKMLAGDQTATSQQFDISSLGTIGFQAATPVNLDGLTLPPSGAPGIFMRMADDGWAGVTEDRLEMFELTVDFNNPANSSVFGPTFLPTDPFDTELNGFQAFAAIPQPGTNLELDPLRELLMNKIIYRNFGTHEVLVCNHVTDVTGNDDAGVRWYELRRVGGITSPWVIHQQGTYSPDNTSRWMASIGINNDGTIGLAYNVSDATAVFPGLRYTGRLECDPLGEMTFPETTIVEGTMSNSSNRYGDYNTLSVDPTDGSFWFTGQYNRTAAWSTRVANFEIEFNCFGIDLSAIDSDQTVCQPDDASYDFELAFLGGFSGNATFTATGIPAGATASFDTNSTNSPGTYNMTITGTGAVTPGTYTINILATDGTESDDINVELTVETDLGSPINLLTPVDNSIDQPITPSYSWSAAQGASAYTIEIATDIAFTNIIETAVITNTSYDGMVLNSATQYYWRVITENSCGTETSMVFTFQTVNIMCQDFTATDVPIEISDGDPNTQISSIMVAASGNIADLKITNLNIQHTWIADLTVTLTHVETSTSAILFTTPCREEDNVIGSFDDTGGALPCPPNGGNYAPEEPFSIFDGESLAGTWTLTVEDDAFQDGGSIESWNLELCTIIPTNTDCPPNYVLTGVQSTSDDFETDGTIVSDQLINSNATVDYDSRISILLEENFEITQGVTFHAFIDGCGGSMLQGDDTNILRN